nr:ubiquitin recognition factor in ER-associated degradation protein 1-like isoform X2 [Tanacetum cinerariifolium]
MMKNLLLEKGDLLRVKNGTLPKSTHVKLQIYTSDFLNISNPKAMQVNKLGPWYSIRETTLRKFSCLTTGDNIMVAYNNKQYYIDIIESKPKKCDYNH